MSQIEDYLSTVTAEQRLALERIIRIAREVRPEAEDGWSYAMPTLKYKGKGLVGFLAWPHHIGLYPFGGEPIEAVKDKLSGYKTSKGAVQFTLAQPLQDETLRHIVRARAQLIDTQTNK